MMPSDVQQRILGLVIEQGNQNAADVVESYIDVSVIYVLIVSYEYWSRYWYLQVLRARLGDCFRAWKGFVRRQKLITLLLLLDDPAVS